MATQMMGLTHNQLLVVWIMMAVFDQIPRELEEQPQTAGAYFCRSLSG